MQGVSVRRVWHQCGGGWRGSNSVSSANPSAIVAARFRPRSYVVNCPIWPLGRRGGGGDDGGRRSDGKWMLEKSERGMDERGKNDVRWMLGKTRGSMKMEEGGVMEVDAG